MPFPSFLTITDQVAEHLRAEILRGRWTGTLPGKHELAADLGLNNKTIEVALRQLEKDGLLISQGVGRRRRINPKGGKSSRSLRVAILTLEEEADRRLDYMVDLYHSLSEAGHTVFYAPQSQTQLRFNLKKIAQLVEQTPADVWLVLAGSREVLEWFASRTKPVFALFGRRQGLRMAGFGPNKVPACVAATRKLIELGHRRVVLLCRRIRRLPSPGPSEQAFLEELSAAGIKTGEYNLPDWEEFSGGFQKCLDGLFQVTPPTAVIVDEAPWFVATLQFLASRGIRVPNDVSLICTDNNDAFAGCVPTIACMTWDTRPLVQRVVQWASNVSRGRVDFRQSTTPSEFVSGGSICRPIQRD